MKELLKLDLELEAGIVNYYTCKSKLNPHSDCRWVWTEFRVNCKYEHCIYEFHCIWISSIQFLLNLFILWISYREENLKPPLLSLSLGEKALFLIGPHRYENPVIPVVLRNGDLMIMSGDSRLAYHSVVKVICDDTRCKRKLIKRINVNVRQVYWGLHVMKLDSDWFTWRETNSICFRFDNFLNFLNF